MMPTMHRASSVSVHRHPATVIITTTIMSVAALPTTFMSTTITTHSTGTFTQEFMSASDGDALAGAVDGDGDGIGATPTMTHSGDHGVAIGMVTTTVIGMVITMATGMVTTMVTGMADMAISVHTLHQSEEVETTPLAR